MKPVTRCTPKARLSKCISPKPPMLLPAGPPPPRYAPPYPPHGYYYPYPYPPPPYHPHQYPPMPLQPQPIPPPPSQTQPKGKKREATSEPPSSMPPRLVSSRSSSPDTSPAADKKSSSTPAANKKSSAASEGGVITPHENDVLMGRGGKNNTHIGNEKLREMARNMREVYIKSRKKEKTNMARQLVHRVFALTPPGRFLQRDPVTMAWEEVDMDTARHKTSQCLRDAATEKSSYHKIKPEPEAGDSDMQVDTTTSAPQATPSRPATPEQSTTAESPDSANSSDLANKIEASPLPPPSSMDGIHPGAPSSKDSIHPGARSRIESWEMGSIANVLIESFEENNESFVTKPRLGSLDISIGSNSQRMYTWMGNSAHDSALDIYMEDAVLIPPEELDAPELDAADENGEPFTLLDVAHMDDEVEMQLWHPDDEEAENPFDTEFFY